MKGTSGGLMNQRPGPYAMPGGEPGDKGGGKDRFPVGDAKHARLAIGGATRAERAHNITPEQAAHVKELARAQLAKARGAKRT